MSISAGHSGRKSVSGIAQTIDGDAAEYSLSMEVLSHAFIADLIDLHFIIIANMAEIKG